MVKRQINVEVDEDVAVHIKSQPHQGKYIEMLVRNEIGHNAGLEERLALIENAVYENHIKIDGIDFALDGMGYSCNDRNELFKFSFAPPKVPIYSGLALQTLADGKTIRRFAVRFSVGHFVGTAKFHYDTESIPCKVRAEFVSLYRIGDSLWPKPQETHITANVFHVQETPAPEAQQT
jgi:hypothetical protein